MPRRYFNYSPEFTTLHQIFHIWNMDFGHWIYNYALCFTKTYLDKAEANPYESASLEWSMPSPPPTLNFENTTF